MDSAAKPDFGPTARDYRRFRAGFPPRLLDGLAAHGIGYPGQDVLDVGTGTGTLARLLAPRVRSMRGVDPSPELIGEARELSAEAGVDITYTLGTAEHTGLGTASVDVVTAGQCWHWFRAAEAGAELARVLRPDGLIAIVHFDWIPLPGNVVEATEQLISQANPDWGLGGGTGLYPRWLTDLTLSGFKDIKTFSFDLDITYTPEAWVGRIRASAGIGGSLPDDEVSRFSDRLTELLATTYPGDTLAVPHRTWAVVARCGTSTKGTS
jgi:SAM-dependent methyltransferase